MDSNNSLILVTDWEKVEADEFYLTNEWLKKQNVSGESSKTLRELQKSGILYIGYIVKALDYCIYSQMDADQVIINSDMDVMLNCESAIIGNDHEKRMEYEY